MQYEFYLKSILVSGGTREINACHFIICVKLDLNLYNIYM